MQGVKFTITSNCKEKVLGQIRERLMDFGENTYKWFTDSCFGHFSNLPKVVGHCNSAIYDVFTYEMEFDDKTEDPTEISFFINNTRLRFRRFEYALIAGLGVDHRRSGKEFDIFCGHTKSGVMVLKLGLVWLKKTLQRLRLIIIFLVEWKLIVQPCKLIERKCMMELRCFTSYLPVIWCCICFTD